MSWSSRNAILSDFLQFQTNLFEKVTILFNFFDSQICFIGSFRISFFFFFFFQNQTPVFFFCTGTKIPLSASDKKL